VTVFVDTNVVVYAHDHGAGIKQQRARDVLAEHAGNLVVSTQVLTEFYWVATRKLKPPLSPVQATEAVEQLAAVPVVSTHAGLVLAAIATARHEGLTLWDALIVEAAANAGCDHLITEDLNHGEMIRGVRIENPFLP
jgi:predicted nucleic acid-binding protein